MNPWDNGSTLPPVGRAPDLDRQAILALTERHVNKGLARTARLMNAPLEVSSEGALVFDERGQSCLDCSGYSVFLLGHRHPKAVKAVLEQLQRHPLATRILLNPSLALAAQALVRVAPPGLTYVFFTNSGAEAVETALKLARLNGKTRLISTHGGFHGKTMGALSVTGRAAYQGPFLPLLPDVQFVPFGDLAALEQALAGAGGKACVIVEPIQAEAGVIIPAQGYLRGVRELCTHHRALLVVDEIQTGCGRTGAWWASDAEGVVADILLAGKGLSAGLVPVAALVATEDAFEPFNRDPFLHTSTFAGNPLAMAAARAAIHVLGEEGLVDRGKWLGKRLLEGLTEVLGASCPHLVQEIRGAGLLLGIEFKGEHLAGDFLCEVLRRRVLMCHSLNAHRVVRLTPPAILTEAEGEWLLGAVREAGLALGRRWPRTEHP